MSELKEAVIEGIRSIVIPELKDIKSEIRVINAKLDGIDKRFEELRIDVNNRFEDMNKRFEELRTDVNKRFEELRTDVNKRFEESFLFHQERFNSIEKQINNILAELRELRAISSQKVDIIEFKRLENKYLDLFKEINELRRKVA